MSGRRTLRIWVNRVVAFLFGALFIFIFLQVTVISNTSILNAHLKQELDEIKYEPGRLLIKGQTYFENNDYANAKLTLTSLFEKHPASEEVTAGKALYVAIETKQEEMDKKWAAVLPEIREEWEKATIIRWREDLKEQYQKDSEKLENNLVSKIEAEWISVEKELRQKWESDI